MQVQANAKINLGLDILGVRQDGYHSIRTVMQALALHDILQMEPCSEPGILLSTDRPELPADETNLVWRAAHILMRDHAPDAGIRIRLCKRIPMQAGLAGGSADAAAALKGVNAMLRLGLGEEDLLSYAAKLGADVPFCLRSGTALAEGIGEILTPLPAMPECAVLLCKPAEGISTALAYRELDREPVLKHPDIDGIMEGLWEGSLKKIAAKLENVFEPGAVRHIPLILTIRERMLGHHALSACMTGSGPTVFGIFPDAAGAGKCAQELRQIDGVGFVCVTTCLFH